MTAEEAGKLPSHLAKQEKKLNEVLDEMKQAAQHNIVATQKLLDVLEQLTPLPAMKENG